MATRADELRHGVGAWWQSVVGEVGDGWDRLRQSAATALTRFRPGEATGMPAAHEVDDAGHGLGQGWAMLGADVYDDERRVVVRLEVPGLSRPDLRVDVDGQTLVVRGEKRFAREADPVAAHGPDLAGSVPTPAGRWRMLQCAYGAFQRRLPLPAAVDAGRARATYRDGVLRIELPKVGPTSPSTVSVTID